MIVKKVSTISSPRLQCARVGTGQMERSYYTVIILYPYQLIMLLFCLSYKYIVKYIEACKRKTVMLTIPMFTILGFF